MAKGKSGFWWSSQKLKTSLFYFTLLFLPTQLGKHFWPSFAFLEGIKIDYLSPTLYLTDISTLFLFFLSLTSIRKRFIFSAISQPKIIIFLGFILLLLFVSLISLSPQEVIYGLIKLLEMIFFAIVCAKYIQNKKSFTKVVYLFSIGVLIESGLAIGQSIHQSSLGGWWYFLGERTFTAQTLGIANAAIHGILLLRPYGTFSHPNVLAGYLVISLCLIASWVVLNFRRLNLAKRIYFLLLFLSGICALILSLSRVAITAFVIVGVLFLLFNRAIVHKNRFHLLFFILLFILVVLFISPLGYRFLQLSLTDETYTLRRTLALESLQIFWLHPLLGVGLQNFLPALIKLHPDTPLSFLQPVHNIYLLTLSQTGIIGAIYFLSFLFKTYSLLLKKIKHNAPRSMISLTLLSLVLFIGLFDHYFLTLQQGQLLFAFILGLSWKK